MFLTDMSKDEQLESNKRMQSEKLLRYASQFVVDARRCFYLADTQSGELER